MINIDRIINDACDTIIGDRTDPFSPTKLSFESADWQFIDVAREAARTMYNFQVHFGTQDEILI